jgi:transcriptional regulator with XRE-family HTH domain
MTDRERCPHCLDGHQDPRRVPWAVYLDRERDSSGQPTRLAVYRAGGGHVAQSDADWLRQLIQDHRSDSLRERQQVTVVATTLPPRWVVPDHADHSPGTTYRFGSDGLALRSNLIQEMRDLVASRVVEARRTRELTMEQAAEVGGVSHVTWRRIENAQAVKPPTYAAVDRFLDLPIGTTSLMVERGEVLLAGCYVDLGDLTVAIGDAQDAWHFGDPTDPTDLNRATAAALLARYEIRRRRDV